MKFFDKLLKKKKIYQVTSGDFKDSQVIDLSEEAKLDGHNLFGVHHLEQLQQHQFHSNRSSSSLYKHKQSAPRMNSLADRGYGKTQDDERGQLHDDNVDGDNFGEQIHVHQEEIVEQAHAHGNVEDDKECHHESSILIVRLDD